MSENIFGRVYEVFGNSSSDLLLKTKGQLKVQYGNKYIDLIKDGKVNYPKEEIERLINEIVEAKLNEYKNL
jgi:DNA primase large subunit